MEADVRSALIAAGFDADMIFLEETPSGKVGGYVISPKFSGMSQLARQESFWRELRLHLNEEQLQSVVMILTMAPEEIEDLLESSE